MSNPFDKFNVNNTTHFIEALDASVTLRDLTYAESEKFLKQVISGEEADGTPIINMDALSDTLLEKISLVMIEPAMTVEQLQSLAGSSRSALAEIGKIVEGLGDEGKSASPTETSST